MYKVSGYKGNVTARSIYYFVLYYMW